MRRNKIFMVLAVMMIALAGMSAVSASGTPEQRTRMNPALQSEHTDLSGILEDTGDEVILKTEDGTYSLSARGGRLIDIADYLNTEVSVSGFMVSQDACDYDGHVFVTSAQSDGSTVELDSSAQRQYQAQSPYQMMGGRFQNQTSSRMPYANSGSRFSQPGPRAFESQTPAQGPSRMYNRNSGGSFHQMGPSQYNKNTRQPMGPSQSTFPNQRRAGSI